jgi:hypothetical protein
LGGLLARGAAGTACRDFFVVILSFVKNLKVFGCGFHALTPFVVNGSQILF